ncbi:hypothetical protein [Luteimicrobium subarcticum]|uniref:Uncharacterized protein n=1 Tax=Luteimicrobium subarcticum TaxID=620910 RepID=A0A2M8WT52_9MICO|nr:hypothetical protein [Luteimicrobium subarcticum]PJI94089.1 hypothetical protein CLV34_1575 [Luteimicrobium subarcticum]
MNETAETVVGLRSGVAELLSSGSDQARMREIWLRRGRADWNPTTDGWASVRAWFEAVEQVVS